jgi:hypothetical protein
MASNKNRFFGCQVPPGGAKKGCGGGAKVISVEKLVKSLEKRVAKVEKKVAKKPSGTKNIADGANRRRPGGVVDR